MYHYHSVFVIGVSNCESFFRQTVKESFLCIAIILESLVIVKVVSCQVCENTSSKRKSAYSFLGYAVAAAFHKGILATSLNHCSQKFVKGYRVGGCLMCRNGFAVYVIANGGAQTAFVPHFSKHVIEQSGYRGFSVCSGYSYKFNMF